MSHAFFLAYHYIRSTPRRFAILVFCLSIALALPINTYVAVDILSQSLLQRGERTPILIGRKGNEYALTMNALYFQGSVRETTTMSTFLEMAKSYSGTSVPLYITHTASQVPIVGTNVDYLEQRQMVLEEGRNFVGLGEIVIGAAVAKSFHVVLGDTIRSDLNNLYNIAGSYPMTLQVVGIAKTTGTADDQAIFADVKTVWSLDGLFHGHEEVTAGNALNGNSDSENLEATAAIFMFSDLTEQNRKSFHMHGELEGLPLSSVAFFPKDQAEQDILLGRMALSDRLQGVIPTEIVESILNIVLKVQQGLNLYFIVLVGTSLLFYGLVMNLSLQLRKNELYLMRRIGGSRRTIRNVVMAEVILVTTAALVLTSLFSMAFLFLIRYGMTMVLF